ncbi:MAG: transposon-transfer assisting family protein [Lachnospiraceae bacterium]
MTFTHDEINMMCIFNTESKQSLLSDFSRSIPHVEDAELLKIMQSCKEKLNILSNEDFAQIIFHPDFDLEKMEV